MHSIYPVIVSEKSTAVQKKVQVNVDKLAVCLMGERDLQVGPSAHPETTEPEPGTNAGCSAARHAQKPPLCKGRWLGFRGPGEAQRQRGAVTEGMHQSLPCVKGGLGTYRTELRTVYVACSGTVRNAPLRTAPYSPLGRPR